LFGHPIPGFLHEQFLRALVLEIFVVDHSGMQAADEGGF
jgi:hypothetical protein